jgi:hypothetical protein
VGLLSRLQHAFAVDPPGPADPTPEQQEAVDLVCREVARRRLTTPGLIGLEMSRPLNYLSAQLMHFVAPGVWAVVKQQSYANYQHFAEFLEKRGSIEYLSRRIEHFEAEYEQRDRDEAARRRSSRGAGDSTGSKEP